jgi:hypothetical protein
MTMLLPFISKQLNGVIWRIEIDSLTDTVFLEIRNEANKNVSFSSINLTSGKINFTDITTPERWLTGMEAGYDGILLLHNYQSENTPVHKGIIAIDNKGTLCWSNYTHAFDHLSVNGPVLYNVQIQPKKLFLADITTGTFIRTFEPQTDVYIEDHIIMPDISSSSRLEQNLPVEPYENSICYLDHNNFRIVSLHSFKAKKLRQHLYVMDGTRVIYEDLLNADIQKMQPEPFIIYKDSLIYIKNKSELKVLNL